jgi:hypothetical protein
MARPSLIQQIEICSEEGNPAPDLAAIAQVCRGASCTARDPRFDGALGSVVVATAALDSSPPGWDWFCDRALRVARGRSARYPSYRCANGRHLGGS